MIQAEFGGEKCRFINAYGPQECADRKIIIEFYSRLDQEIKNAKLLDCLICLQTDANAKLGCEIIKGDIHPKSANGEILENIIFSNDLILCNADKKCEGLFTRERITVNGSEKSIIDYFIICEQMYKYFDKMKIDSENALMRYSKSNKKVKITRSDHHLLVCSFNIRKPNLKEQKSRIEHFNFKDPEGWKKFKSLTSGHLLTDCFKNVNMEEESRIWHKKFMNILHRSFTKIRLTKKLQCNLIHNFMVKKAYLFDQIKELTMNYTLNEKHRVDMICKVRIEIDIFDDMIADLSSENNAYLIKQHFINLSNKGGFSLPKMWKLKQKLNLKGNDPPMAKMDKNGQLITTKQGILNLYETEYIERLAQNNPHEKYKDIQKLKEDLFKRRFKLGSNRKTEDWSYGDLEKICMKLANNKARDRDGFIYELFKPKNCGSDLLKSMVKMFNQMKNSLIIPKFLQKMSITSIWKGKGSRSSLTNERGIFNLSRPRVVIDKLLYQDIYDTVDNNLSCSNAGGRRGRGIRDQLFIIQGIINEVINGRSKPICFSLWTYGAVLTT